MASTSPHQAVTNDAISIVTPSELRCKYTNKFCNNQRARKADNKLHSLCEEHRAKANRNQQRLRENQRLQREMQSQRLSDEDTAPAGDEDRERVLLEPLSAAADGNFTASEWQMIVQALSDSSDAASGHSSDTEM